MDETPLDDLPVNEMPPVVPDTPPAEAAPALCLRCGQLRPLGEDGFCAECERAMEQACL